MPISEMEDAAAVRRSYDNLSLAERVLDVIECANQYPVVTVKRISAECGIPAPSGSSRRYAPRAI